MVPTRNATRAWLTVLVALAVAAPGAAGRAASTESVNLLEAFRIQLPKVGRATTLPILLPRTLRLAGPAPKLYASGAGRRASWVLTLAGAPRCRGASACFVASFEARRGKRLPGRSNLRLVGGVRALYQPISCGASCSPASLWFVRDGVLHSWQLKDPPRRARAAFIRMANEAIRAGSRG